MQYFTIISLLAASLSGVQAGESLCTSGNFNKGAAKWPQENYSGRAGSVSTIQQVCTDINKDFKSDEEKWDCRAHRDLKYKVMVKKVGKVNTQLDGKLDEKWCKDIMAQIVTDCLWGGSQKVSNWKFSAYPSTTDCGK